MTSGDVPEVEADQGKDGGLSFDDSLKDYEKLRPERPVAHGTTAGFGPCKITTTCKILREIHEIFVAGDRYSQQRKATVYFPHPSITAAELG